MNIQQNPSYAGVNGSHPRVKPANKDCVNVEQNPSYAAVGCSDFQAKPVAETHSEEDHYYY